jgi:hypothetical protein
MLPTMMVTFGTFTRHVSNFTGMFISSVATRCPFLYAMPSCQLLSPQVFHRIW